MPDDFTQKVLSKVSTKKKSDRNIISRLPGKDKPKEDKQNLIQKAVGRIRDLFRKEPDIPKGPMSREKTPSSFKIKRGDLPQEKVEIPEGPMTRKPKERPEPETTIAISPEIQKRTEKAISERISKKEGELFKPPEPTISPTPKNIFERGEEFIKKTGNVIQTVGRFLSGVPSDDKLTDQYQELKQEGASDEEAKKILTERITETQTSVGMIPSANVEFKKFSELTEEEKQKEIEEAEKFGYRKPSGDNRVVVSKDVLEVKDGKVNFVGQPSVDVFGAVQVAGNVTRRLGRKAVNKIAKSSSFDEIFQTLGKHKGLSQSTKRTLAKRFIKTSSKSQIRNEFSARATDEISQRTARLFTRRKAAQTIARTENTKEISKALQGAGVNEKVSNQISFNLKKVRNVSDAESVITYARGFGDDVGPLGDTTPIQGLRNQVNQYLQEITPQVESKVPTPDDALFKLPESHPVRVYTKQIKKIRGRVAVGKVSRKEANKRIRNLKKIRLEEGKKAGIATFTNSKGEEILAIRRSGFYAHADIAKQPINNVNKGISSPLNMALYQDGLAKEGGKFGAVVRRIHRPSQEAIAGETVFRNEIAGKAVKIKKKYKLGGLFKEKAHGKIITDITETVPREDLFNLSTRQIKNKYPQLEKYTDNFINGTRELNQLADELRAHANEVRRALGKDEIGLLPNYAPHMQKVNFWRTFRNEEKTTISSLFDFIIPNQKANPRAWKRYNDMPEKLREKNFFKLIDSYIDSMAKDIYYTPAIENAKSHVKILKDRGLHDAASYWDTYIRTALAGKPGTIDTALKAMPNKRVTKILRKIQEVKIKSMLVGNVLWSLVTQPSSLSFTLKETGVKNTVLGAWDWFTNPALRKEIFKTTSMRIKTGRGSTIAYRGILDKFDNQVFRSNIDKFNDVMAMLANAEERHLQGMSMAAGIRQGRKFGFVGDELMYFANNVGEVSQSMYNRGSRPLVLNNNVIKAAFPFKTFSLEAFSHVKTLFGKEGMKASAKTRFAMGINLIMGILASNEYSKATRGYPLWSPGSFVPFVGEGIDVALDEALGTNFQQFTTREPIAPLEDIKEISKAVGEIRKGAEFLSQEKHDNTLSLARAIGDYAKDGNFQKFREQLLIWGLGLSGISGAVQFNRMIDGIIASERGYVQSKWGKKLFDVEGTDKPFAVVFGPWSTPSGMEYSKEADKLYEEVQKQSKAREDITTRARIMVKQLNELSSEEANSIFNELEESNPKLADRIEQLKKEEDFSGTERKMNQLGVENWRRAENVWEYLKENFDNSEERNAKYKEWQDKGIISDRVDEQIRGILKQEEIMNEKEIKRKLKQYRRERKAEGAELLDTAKEGEVPEFSEGAKDEETIIDVISTYAKAIGTDPKTAFNRIFTGQRIRRVDSGAIIVERMPFRESQRVREERGATSAMRLDHTIPLELGGSNNKDNLKLVPVEVWASYTPVENRLGELIRDEKVTGKQAKKLIKKFKEGEITSREVFDVKNKESAKILIAR